MVTKEAALACHDGKDAIEQLVYKTFSEHAIVTLEGRTKEGNNAVANIAPDGQVRHTRHIHTQCKSRTSAANA